MVFKKHYTIRWLFSCLIFFGCSNKSTIEYISAEEQKVFLEKKMLQEEWLKEKLPIIQNSVNTGDLIVREGNDFTSQSLKQLNQRDKTYSHIGIVSKENDSLFIYHIMGGEWNPDARILREPLSNFVSPSINNQFAIYRLKINDIQKNEIVKNAIDFRRKEVQFDMNFDLKTEKKMYCAEFVYHCVQTALPPNSIHTSHIKNFEFVGVDDIILIPEAKKIIFADYLTTKLWLAD